MTPSVRIGLLSLCAALSAGCETVPAIQTVEVPGPVSYIRVPDSCLLPIPLNDQPPMTNGDLLQLAVSYRARIEQANAQLECVRALQPK